VIQSYNKSQRDALFLNVSKKLYMFRTDLLSIIRSLNTVYTAVGICHASCAAVCQRGQDGTHPEFFIKINLRNSASRWFLL
jgi:hypothetical protein